jgi:cytochrome c-type biogenesis protein CcmF
MPWLAGTALLCSALVMEKREALKIWTILLAILSFSLSLTGTFLVRSGVLTSVHAFASDPMRGVFILAILVVFICGSLALFAWRASTFKQGGLFAPVSREGALVLNNLFLVSACLTVFVGTLYPLALETLTGQKLSVGAPFFNATFGPLFVLVLIAMPFGPLLAWKRGDLLGVAQRLVAACAIALVAAAATYGMAHGGSGLAPLGIGLAVFVMAGAVTDVVERVGLLRLPIGVALQRAAGLPRSVIGMALAHFGLGVTLLGVVCTTSWGTERIITLKPNDVVSLAGYDLTLDGLDERQGPNYRELVGRFTVRRDSVAIAAMEPSKRGFQERETTTTQAALLARGLSQLYLSLGDTDQAGSTTVRLYHKPLVLMIWLGALQMTLGGVFSFSDRRLRVGAPRPAAAKPAAA